MSIITILLDVVLIGFLIAGVRYAMRLSRQLALMRESRADMERFVLDFNVTIARIEKGIQTMKSTARACGDDLEELIDRGHALKDELQLLSQSADQIANRLASRPSVVEAEAPLSAEQEHMRKAQAVLEEIRAMAGAPPLSEDRHFASTAERDLMVALAKQG
ncbi:MAG: DUF6468 domain-containing protein [Alphaproteobacteria bacterium]|nr:DUF6468 domain-containing protein [Alphaproteobacteria bacterium]